jgi:hypothetical protein
MMLTVLDSETRALLDQERRRGLLNSMVEEMETAAGLLQDYAKRVAAQLPGCQDVTVPTVAIEDLRARTCAVLTQVRLHELALRRVVPACRGTGDAGEAAQERGEMQQGR